MTQDRERETDPVPPTRLYTRDVPTAFLVEDPLFKNLFLPDPKLITQLAARMRAHGFDQARPIDVWKNGAGRGRHIVLDGHQRLAAAKKAGLETVHVVYREPVDYDAALLWAAQQQGVRRNASREQQALGVLRAMWAKDGKFRTTRELAALYKFAAPTIDRAKQLLQQGNDSEILAVLEGTHGLRKGYELMLKRINKKTDKPAASKRPPILTVLRDALAKAIDGGKIELPEMLRHATALYRWLDGQAPGLAEEEDEEDEDQGDE